MPVAADESIRRAEDPYRVVALDAADVAVLKVAPLGGVRAALEVAERIGLPVVVSSAVGDLGRARGRGGAGRRPARAARTRAGSRPSACWPTTSSPSRSRPVDGMLPVRPVVVDEERLAAVRMAPGDEASGATGWPAPATWYGGDGGVRA